MNGILHRFCSNNPLFALAVFFIFSGNLLPAFGQSIKISLGNNQIGSNEIFTITLVAMNQSLDDYTNFPAIEGFNKAGTSSSSSMRSINGVVTNETSIIQNYMPTKEGTFKLPPFSIKIGNVVVKSPGTTIKVGPPVEYKQTDPFAVDPFAYDPFEDFFGTRKSDLKDEKADAFLNVQVDKREVWAGEGINVILSFLVADENRAELDFYDLGNQLAELVRKIKPANCWEENFGIEEIIPRKINIGKKVYTEYRIYQATIFPLVPKSFTIPALSLKMVNYKTASSATFFGAPRKQEVKAFSSKPIQILVKELPPHPLRGNVSVGQFAMKETVDHEKVELNQGVAVELAIKGEGNITYIPEPTSPKSEFVDLYPPNTRQTIQRAGGRVTGEKVFSYLLVPKELGTMPLNRVFSWIYFNSKLGKYDTLSPKGTISVVPQSGKKGTTGTVKSQNAFYSLIDQADRTEIRENEEKPKWLLWVNISIGLMIATTLWLSFVKKAS